MKKLLKILGIAFGAIIALSMTTCGDMTLSDVVGHLGSDASHLPFVYLIAFRHKCLGIQVYTTADLIKVIVGHSENSLCVICRDGPGGKDTTDAPYAPLSIVKKLSDLVLVP